MEGKIWVVTVRVKQYQFEDRIEVAATMEAAKEKAEAKGLYVTGVSTYSFED